MIADQTSGNEQAAMSPRRGSRSPRIYVSVFGPSTTRRRAWFTGRCRCGTHVFGAVASLECLPCPRRLSCGHVAIVTPARVYRSQPDQASAA